MLVGELRPQTIDIAATTLEREIPEHVVEGAILEHQDNDVVDLPEVVPCRSQSPPPPSRSRWQVVEDMRYLRGSAPSWAIGCEPGINRGRTDLNGLVTDDRGAGADRRCRGLEAALGIADHARDGVRLDRAPRRPQGPRRDQHREHQLDRTSTGRGDAGARALLRCLEHRPQSAAAWGLGSAAAARYRAAADDRTRSARRRRDLRRVDLLGGRDRRGDPGADRRRPRPGGRHRAARPDSDPPGPERRERAQ